MREKLEIISKAYLSLLNLEAIKKGDSEYTIGGLTADDISTQLNDLLIPEVFARRDAEGNIEEFVYMEDIETDEIEEIEAGNREIKKEEREQGRAEMRKEAGIAMEYLEKDEGEFLKDWEVIYGGDKYEILTSYIDERLAPIRKELEEMIESGELEDELTEKELEEYEDFVNNISFPSREDLEDAHEAKVKIEFYLSLVDAVFDFSAFFPGPSSSKISLGQLGNKILKRAVQEGSIEAASNLDERLGYFVELTNKGLTGFDYEDLGEHIGEEKVKELQKEVKRMEKEIEEELL